MRVESKAEELKKSLEKKYPAVRVQASSVPVTVYRVRITEPDAETANKIAAELRKHDLKPFVVRVNGKISHKKAQKHKRTSFCAFVANFFFLNPAGRSVLRKPA